MGGKLIDWGVYYVDIVIWGMGKMGMGLVVIDFVMVEYLIEFIDGCFMVEN